LGHGKINVVKAIFAYVCFDFQAELVEMEGGGIEQQAFPR
jgi:hypothetical protein